MTRVTLLGLACLAFAVPAPRHLLGFGVALLLGASSVFSLGLLVAALAPSARAATGLGVSAGIVSGCWFSSMGPIMIGLKGAVLAVS